MSEGDQTTPNTESPDGRDTARRVRRTPLWVKLLLVVSLGLNLAVAGMVGGAVWRLRDDDRGPRVSPPLGIVLFRALEPEDRRALREEMGGRIRPHRISRRAIVIEIPQALRVDPPNLEALSEIMNTEHARHTDWLRLSNEAWLNHVASMSPEARAAYADRIEEAMRRTKKDPKEAKAKPGDKHRWKEADR